MKYLIVLIALFWLPSCSENPQKIPAEKPLLITRDSNVIRTEAPNPYAGVDVSPMDMSWYPANFPVAKMSGEVSGEPVARVIYSRPHKQGRNIFGSLIKYGEPWRMGANEATEIEFFKPVNIQNKKVAQGRYILYCIPEQDKWTIVLNSNLYAWGLKVDASKDVYRFEAPVQSTSQPVEYFSIVFREAGKGADMVVAWDSMVVRLPLQF